MKTQLDEEKELLIMKGDALRTKLYAQSIKRDNSLFISDTVTSVASSLNQPIIRSLAVSLISKKLLTTRFAIYSGLAAIALYLLAKDENHTN